ERERWGVRAGNVAGEPHEVAGGRVLLPARPGRGRPPGRVADDRPPRGLPPDGALADELDSVAVGDLHAAGLGGAAVDPEGGLRVRGRPHRTPSARSHRSHHAGILSAVPAPPTMDVVVELLTRHI